MDMGEVGMVCGLVACSNSLCHELVSCLPWPEVMLIFHIARVGEVAPSLVPGFAQGRQLASLPRAVTAG